MKASDRYDSLIQFYCSRYNLKWWMIKKQVLAESSFDPEALSPVGARGVAQFMAPTWAEWNDPDYNPPVTSQDLEDFLTALNQFGFRRVEKYESSENFYQELDLDEKTERQLKQLLTKLLDNPHNPEEGIKAMCAYMAHLYSRFKEIPDPEERWKFAVASYNCGRGNVNKMLELARRRSGLPGNYYDWRAEGRPAGKWQTWEFAKQHLVEVTGEDHSRETLGYVQKIAA